jgi:glycosyltransferase involved in cell wall biosynthesis
MNILHLISSTKVENGGPVVGLSEISKYYQRNGHTITICTFKNDLKNSLFDPEIEIINLGKSYTSYNVNFSLFSWLLKNSENYDSIVVNGVWEYQGFCIYLVSHFRKIRYFVIPHGMLDPGLKIFGKLKHLKKAIYWYLIESRVTKRATNVIFTNNEEANLARNNFYPYQIKESVMDYGISSPPQKDEYYRRLFLEKNSSLIEKKIILFLSRVHPKKGLKFLIQALARIIEDRPNLHLVIAGAGEEKYINSLKSYASTLGLDSNITWLGMVSGEDKWSAFYGADIFCLPSNQENFGIVVAESLGCGLPVLISDKINIHNKIEKCGAGFVDENSVEGAYKLLSKWYELNEDEKLHMRSNAKQCFAAHFSLEGAGNSMMKILNSDRLG